jgi:beta-lactamase regulating signal transducer with metallopeptidase domain
MRLVVEALNGAGDVAASLAWAVTWQSTLMVGAVAMIAKGLRRSSPGLRCWLWRIAAIKLLAMPLWVVTIALEPSPRRGARSEAVSPARSGVEAALPADRPRALDGETIGPLPREAEAAWSWIARVDWQAWLLMGWGLAVSWQVAAIARQRSLLERLLGRATPADDPALLALTAELSGRIGLRPPRVVIIEGAGSPFVCGLRCPTLVLPRELSRTLDPSSLRPILLHELAHLRRRDLVWDWIPATARVLYFFHPAAHYIEDRAHLERELACDQAAMVLAGLAPADYAAALIEALSRPSASAAFE